MLNMLNTCRASSKKVLKRIFKYLELLNNFPRRILRATKSVFSLFFRKKKKFIFIYFAFRILCPLSCSEMFRILGDFEIKMFVGF